MQAPDVGLTDGQFELRGLSFAAVDELQRLLSKMVPKRRRFVFEYAVDHNGTRAARDSGFSVAAAPQEASRLLRDVKVRRALDILQGRVARKLEVTVERVTEVLRRIAEFNPKALKDEKGNLIPLENLPDEVATALGVEIEGGALKLKSLSKEKAAELLGKRLKMWVDRTEHDLGRTLEDIITESTGDGNGEDRHHD